MSRKNKPKYAFFTVVGLVVLAAVTGALIDLVYLKNRQIETARLIEQAHDRKAEAELDLRMVKLNESRLLNRFALTQRLEQNDSRLQAINFGVVETIDLHPSEAPPGHLVTLEP